jgi:hypothetical protein
MAPTNERKRVKTAIIGHAIFSQSAAVMECDYAINMTIAVHNQKYVSI